MIDIICEMLSYSFMLRAVIVGILVSLCAALLGVSMVLRRSSMIGDGLSHVGFAALAIAAVLNITPLVFAVPVCIVAAFLLLRLSRNSRINSDAAIAIVCSGALAIGIMAVSLTTGMNTDINNYMFGSILSLSKSDAILSVVLSVVVIAMFILLFNRIFAITFDETFAKATGTRAGLYNAILAVLTAVTVVLGMRMMGALLISSLIIFPPLTAMRLCKNYRSVIVTSVIVSVICFIAGVFVSFVMSTPTGASVVCINIIAFIAFSLIRLIKTRIIRRG